LKPHHSFAYTLYNVVINCKKSDVTKEYLMQ